MFQEILSILYFSIGLSLALWLATTLIAAVSVILGIALPEGILFRHSRDYREEDCGAASVAEVEDLGFRG